MRKKSESLTFPSNPLAAMRELQDLDAPAPKRDTPPTPKEKVIAVAAPPSTEPTSSIVAETTTLPTNNIPLSTTDHTTTLPVAHTTSNTTALPTQTDPLRAALLQTIQQPVVGDLSKGPFTVSSIKVHNTVWERLGYASQLTGRNKQDLVSEALLDLFAKISREEKGM
jgi:hypothetical protein